MSDTLIRTLSTLVWRGHEYELYYLPTLLNITLWDKSWMIKVHRLTSVDICTSAFDGCVSFFPSSRCGHLADTSGSITNYDYNRDLDIT